MIELTCYIDSTPNVFYPIEHGYVITNAFLKRGSTLRVRTEPVYKLPMLEVYEYENNSEEKQVFYFTSSFKFENQGSYLLARSSIRSNAGTTLPRLKTPLFIVYEAANVATLVANPTFSPSIDSNLKL